MRILEIEESMLACKVCTTTTVPFPVDSLQVWLRPILHTGNEDRWGEQGNQPFAGPLSSTYQIVVGEVSSPIRS